MSMGPGISSGQQWTGTGTYTVNTDMWVTTGSSVPLPMSCLVCDTEVEGGSLCELCRQAILLFRKKVLEQMARDLLGMGDSAA